MTTGTPGTLTARPRGSGWARLEWTAHDISVFIRRCGSVHLFSLQREAAAELSCASCSLLHRGVCCMSVGSGFGPSSRVVNSFHLNKGIVLVGFESLLCCAPWDKCSALRSSLGCC